MLRGSASQAEMAAKFGVSQVAYGRWELGKAEPKYDVLLAICKNFSVSSDWLLGLTDERTPGVSITAGDGSAVAANRSTATVTSAPAAAAGDVARLIGIIESQQAVIAALTGAGKKA